MLPHDVTKFFPPSITVNFIAMGIRFIALPTLCQFSLFADWASLLRKMEVPSEDTLLLVLTSEMRFSSDAEGRAAAFTDTDMYANKASSNTRHK